MRFLAFLFILLLPAFASAQTDEQNGHAFGSINCPQKITCPGGLGQETDYISVANACIAQYFGYSSEQGFFVDYAGLNSDYCLSAIPGVLPKGVGAQLSPLCCLTSNTEGSCGMHCDLVAAPQ